MSKSSLAAGVLVVAVLVLVLVQTSRHRASANGKVTELPAMSVEAPEGALTGLKVPFRQRSETLPDPVAPDHALTVKVVDEGGRPVRDVQVLSCLDDTGVQRLGVTNATGMVNCPALEAPFTLVASGDDIQTREMLVERAAPLVQMVVRRGAHLTGRVVCSGSDELPASSSTRVVAWPNSWRVPPRELARRVLSADPRALATTADENGFFELSGLAPDTPYAVTAVTPGWCVWPPLVLDASEGNLLRMECVLGVRVSVCEIGGKPVALPPLRAYGRRVPLENLDMRGARYVPSPNPIAELFGCGEGLETGDPTRMELLFTCPEELGMLGPIAFEADIPGYRSESVDLWALLTDHGISEQTVEVLRSAESSREVHLEFTGVPSLASRKLAIRGKIGQIVLVDSEQQRWYVDLCDLSSSTMTIRDVPRSLRFEGVHLNAEYPTSLPCELASATEDSESWLVDLSEFQAVTVELRQPDDTQYLGPAIFLAGSSEEQLDGMISFEHGPFVLMTKRTVDLCVLVFEPESLLLESDVVAQSATMRRASLGWH